MNITSHGSGQRKSNADIYRDSLSNPSMRGRPMWIPQTNRNLPKEYRAQGVLIGDVGIFTPEGAFDFLFNILLSPSDPINPRKLPQGFASLSPPLEDIDIRKFNEFGKGSYISSSSVSQVQGGPSQDLGTVFESSAAEGAILMMPDGASVEELCNITILREYIAKNAESFYDYANNVRGREVENGRLHVVYGVRKGASWGMASFSNTSANSNLRLQFVMPREGGDAASALGWEHTVHHGTAEVKVGPHVDENAGLPGTEDGRRLSNQCLFASTLSIRLSDDIWNKHQPKETVQVHYRDRSDSENDSVGFSSSSAVSPQRANATGVSANTGSLRGPRRGSNRSLQLLPTSIEPSPSESDSECNHDVILEASGPSSGSAYYSEILTDYLLKMVPSANVAICGERDWSGFTPANNPTALIENVCASNNVCEKDGVAFFEPKEYKLPAQYVADLKQSLDNGTFDLHEYIFSRSNLTTDFSYPGHPRQFISIDKIMDYAAQKESSTSSVFSAHASVFELRDHLRQHTPPQPDSDHALSIQNLANTLLNRYIGFSQLDDLDEAIWLFEHALALTPRDHYRYLECLLGLSTSLNARFELRRLTADHHRLAECASDRLDIDDYAVLAPVTLALSTTCTMQQAPAKNLYSSTEPPDAVASSSHAKTNQTRMGSKALLKSLRTREPMHTSAHELLLTNWAHPSLNAALGEKKRSSL
ncbi:hypothetical protein HYPSUDRAFT_979471 [Hypholoma sublateritium FD-334 SS-4]|uniref:Uncharacterized protein n=1 Tax=Hypholoma sublateritium (strain FD-334 SS-4) TaxID=945553 RepID=A0A0D2P7Q5_HYPSF|nr:hypothetical protein HYPSUDRAFT_979471 [Hypholoma sublateritium FD-334 SS-4]